MSEPLLICYFCKDMRPPEMFHKNYTRKRGYTDRCKECYQVYQKQWYLKNKEKVIQYGKDHNTNINRRYSKSKYAAITTRKLEWTLTLEEFINFDKLDCYYCDGYFEKTKTACGLDRVDNNKGYSIDNVLPCCGTCNVVRSNKFSVQETKEMIKTVIEFRKKNG